MNLPWQSADRHSVLVGLPWWKWVLSSHAHEMFLITPSEMIALTGWLMWLSLISCNQNEPGEQSTVSEAAQLSFE